MKAGLRLASRKFLKMGKRETLRAHSGGQKDAGKTYFLHDGPPFANGDVHMGTALDKIEGFRNQVAHNGGLSSSVRSWLGLPWAPDEFKVARESKGCLRWKSQRSEAYAEVYRHPEETVPSARGARRLGQTPT